MRHVNLGLSTNLLLLSLSANPIQGVPMTRNLGSFALSCLRTLSVSRHVRHAPPPSATLQHTCIRSSDADIFSLAENGRNDDPPVRNFDQLADSLNSIMAVVSPQSPPVDPSLPTSNRPPCSALSPEFQPPNEAETPSAIGQVGCAGTCAGAHLSPRRIRRRISLECTAERIE